MSAELPQLERLIADAAERHYGGRRWLHVPVPRLSLVAGLVVATAAVVLAIAILPLRSDEQSAQPPADLAAQLAKRYSVFAGTQTPTKLEDRALSELGTLVDRREPTTTRLLRRFATGGGVVGTVGTSAGRPAVCVTVTRPTSGGSSCERLATAVSSRGPSFIWGGIGRSPNEVIALVPDDVTSVRIDVEGGATHELSLANNFAYRAGGQPICRVTWTFADGRTGHERGPTRAEEATADDPNPPTCD
jgi:hypothetical protein